MGSLLLNKIQQCR